MKTGRVVFPNLSPVPHYRACDPMFRNIFHAWKRSVGALTAVGQHFSTKALVRIANEVVQPIVDICAGLEELVSR